MAKSSTTISVPENLSLDAIAFARSLRELAACDEYVLDFSKTKRTEPFGMLLLSSEIQRCVRSRPDTKFSCINIEQMSYAAHMGFFQSFGAEFGKKPGQAIGSSTYVPITILTCEQIERDAAVAGHEVGQEVEELSRKLAVPLCGRDSGDTYEAFVYSIRELIRNVVEHSESKKFGVCGQYWPSTKRAEVAVIDRGVGLRHTLQRNPHLDASDDKKAINYALMPAVSGKAFKGGPRQNKYSNWINSGFGLYMTSRICRDGGNFFLGSGDAGMLLTSGKGSKRYFSMSHDGTVVRMRINTSGLTGLKDALDRYRNEGYEIQRKYAEIVDIDPSAASLMLSEDFDLNVWERILARVRSVVR